MLGRFILVTAAFMSIISLFNWQAWGRLQCVQSPFLEEPHALKRGKQKGLLAAGAWLSVSVPLSRVHHCTCFLWSQTYTLSPWLFNSTKIALIHEICLFSFLPCHKIESAGVWEWRRHSEPLLETFFLLYDFSNTAGHKSIILIGKATMNTETQSDSKDLCFHLLDKR